MGLVAKGAPCPKAHARCAPLVYVQYASPSDALQARTRFNKGILREYTSASCAFHIRTCVWWGNRGACASPPNALRTRTYFCAVRYRLREISETAAMPDSISSGVLKWEKLKRTHPLSAVPRALCISGAQWAPGRVQMP